MNETPIIASIASAVVVGGLIWYSYTNSFWSDGTPIVYKDMAEANIVKWRDDTKRTFGIKGGRRKKTRKHYK
jgi:hypothetical protein